MLGKLVYPIIIIVALLLIAEALYLFAPAADGRAYLNLSNLLFLAVAIVSVSLLINTNTARPDRPDPNERRRTADAWGLDTADLMAAIDLPDGKPYGNRATDDETVKLRLIAAARSGEYQEPAWVKALKNEMGAENE
jgi:hypothetical protein